MKTYFAKARIDYDGSALTPLHSALKHRITGDSIVAFCGGCDVSFQNMIDSEDLIESSVIQAKNMLHFIVEVFSQNIMTAVSLQRLLVTIAQDCLLPHRLRRDGDDLYFESNDGIAKKLSVSIASVSAVSAMIHLGINISNEGTPVPTCSLQDLGVEPEPFALSVMRQFQKEYLSIVAATQKVRPL